jgi:ABC-2 type transport system ATP-binding protein
MTTNVIETDRLTVYYGRHRGVEGLNLAVEVGEVYGFLGPNGAGKTTTQRVLLDIIRPTEGRARVFGMESQEEGVAIRERIGYLPGELQLPEELSGSDFLRVMAAIRGDDNRAYRQELCERLQLDSKRRIKEYSRGNKQKLGLVAAMMHKPELLILDEPTSGLDPLMQQTVLALVRETREEGRTVFFSSHNLSEVQAVCDRVGIIREGRLAAVERVDSLIKQQFRRYRIVLERAPGEDVFAFPGVTILDRHERSLTVEVRQNLQALLEAALSYGIVDLEAQPVTLEEVFLAYYGRANNRNSGGQHE